jgi:hypothetical protein
MQAYRQSKRLIYSLSTSAVDGGECLNSLSGCFVLRKETPFPIELEAGWTPELLWTFLEKEYNQVVLLEFEPRKAQPAAESVDP